MFDLNQFSEKYLEISMGGRFKHQLLGPPKKMQIRKRKNILKCI
jgi:hypothetical protein